MSGPTDVLEALLEYGAALDAVNDDGATPLFFACQCNNQFAASVLGISRTTVYNYLADDPSSEEEPS